MAELDHIFQLCSPGAAREAAALVRAGMEPVSHTIRAAALTGVRLGLPDSGARSAAAQALEAIGLLALETADDYVLLLTFDYGASHKAADLRPDLKMVLQW